MQATPVQTSVAAFPAMLKPAPQVFVNQVQNQESSNGNVQLLLQQFPMPVEGGVIVDHFPPGMVPPELVEYFPGDPDYGTEYEMSEEYPEFEVPPEAAEQVKKLQEALKNKVEGDELFKLAESLSSPNFDAFHLLELAHLKMEGHGGVMFPGPPNYPNFPPNLPPLPMPQCASGAELVCSDGTKPTDVFLPMDEEFIGFPGMDFDGGPQNGDMLAHISQLQEMAAASGFQGGNFQGNGDMLAQLQDMAAASGFQGGNIAVPTFNDGRDVTTTTSTRPTRSCATTSAQQLTQGGVEVGRPDGPNKNYIALRAVQEGCSFGGVAFSLQQKKILASVGPVSASLNPWSMDFTNAATGDKVSLRQVPANSCVVQGCKSNTWTTDSIAMTSTLSGIAPAGQACYCDDACTQYKDCCADYQSTCNVFVL